MLAVTGSVNDCVHLTTMIGTYARDSVALHCEGDKQPLACAKCFVQSFSNSLNSFRQLQGEEDDPTPFYEPLLRSFVLGLGVGVIFESGHVALRVRLGHCSSTFINNHCLHLFESIPLLLGGFFKNGQDMFRKT